MLNIAIPFAHVTCIVASALPAALPLALHAAPPPPTFDEVMASNPQSGTITLSWQPPAGWQDDEVEYEVRCTGNSADGPTPHYRHLNHKTFVSGLTDGTYEFSVRAGRDDEWTDWCQSHVFTVEHHSVGLALGLCAAGAVVFAATALFVITQSIKAERA
jgi:hypothetical protein